MQLQVTGHHVEVTSAMKSFIAGKLAKLEEIYPKVQKAVVVLTVEKYRHTAEVHFRAEGMELNAKKTTKDMYASVEEAISALEQQAGKRKDRLRTGGALRRDAESKTEKRSARPSRKAAEPEAPKSASQGDQSEGPGRPQHGHGRGGGRPERERPTVAAVQGQPGRRHPSAVQARGRKPGLG